MEQIYENASAFRFRKIVSLGATFGIFLTISSAWGAFIEALVVEVLPDATGTVSTSLTAACVTTVVSVGLLLGIVLFDAQTDRLQSRVTLALARRRTRRKAAAQQTTAKIR